MARILPILGLLCLAMIEAGLSAKSNNKFQLREGWVDINDMGLPPPRKLDKVGGNTLPEIPAKIEDTGLVGEPRSVGTEGPKDAVVVVAKGEKVANHTDNKGRRPCAPSEDTAFWEQKFEQLGPGQVPFLFRFARFLLEKLKRGHRRSSYSLEDILDDEVEPPGGAKRTFKYAAELRLTKDQLKVLHQVAEMASMSGKVSRVRTEQGKTVRLLVELDSVISSMLVSVRPKFWSEDDDDDDDDLIDHETGAGSAFLGSIWRRLKKNMAAVATLHETTLMWAGFASLAIAVLLPAFFGRLKLRWAVTLIFMVSVFWRWLFMYKKALASKMAEAVQMGDCDAEPEPEGFVSWLLGLVGLGSDKKAASVRCRKDYYRTVMIDPLLEVTPMAAFVEVLSHTVLGPLGTLGHHLGQFFASLSENLSWLSSPFVFAFACVSLLLFLIMLFGYKIQLPFFLGAIQPADQRRHPASGSVAEKSCGVSCCGGGRSHLKDEGPLPQLRAEIKALENQLEVDRWSRQLLQLQELVHVQQQQLQEQRQHHRVMEQRLQVQGAQPCSSVLQLSEASGVQTLDKADDSLLRHVVPADPGHLRQSASLMNPEAEDSSRDGNIDEKSEKTLSLADSLDFECVETLLAQPT